MVVDWSNDYYIVTSQRVIWMEKVVGIFDSRMEAPLGTILSVGVETDAVGRILDYGNVIVRTFVGKIPFNNVHHPYHASRLVEEYWARQGEELGRGEGRNEGCDPQEVWGCPFPIAALLCPPRPQLAKR